MATGYDALAKATHVIITFGTAYVFEHAGRVGLQLPQTPRQANLHAADWTLRRSQIYGVG